MPRIRRILAPAAIIAGLALTTAPVAVPAAQSNEAFVYHGVPTAVSVVAVPAAPDFVYHG